MKYLILGSLGAGKTRFAHKLGKSLNYRVVELDYFFMRRDYDKEVPSQIEAENILKNILDENDNVIVEGSYFFPEYFNYFDKIYIIKLPIVLSLFGVIKRGLFEKKDKFLKKHIKQVFKQYLKKDYVNYRYFRYKVIDKYILNCNTDIEYIYKRKEMEYEIS